MVRSLLCFPTYLAIRILHDVLSSERRSALNLVQCEQPDKEFYPWWGEVSPDELEGGADVVTVRRGPVYDAGLEALVIILVRRSLYADQGRHPRRH